MIRALALVLCAGGVSAQQSPPHAEHAGELEELKWERDKELMHTQSPALALGGLEQGDNDMRGRTPALQNSDRAVALLDPEENYRRRLALYDQGATFASAPRVVASAVVRTPAAHPARSAGPQSSAAFESEARPPSFVALGLPTGIVMLLLVLLMRARERRFAMAGQRLG